MPGWLTWLDAARKKRLHVAADAKTKAAPTIEATLKDLEIRHFDEDILKMKIAGWRKHFGYKNSDNFKMGLFFRNVIWQIYEQIQAGTPPDFVIKKGNIRSMWYYIRRPLSQYKELRVDRSGLMGRELQTMIERGLVSYRDFSFQDSYLKRRNLAHENPYVIVLGEKDGFAAVLDEIHRVYRCHTVLMRGQGSFLNVNYMVDLLVNEIGVDITKTFTCIAIVDFDPAGWNIAQEFIDKLMICGVRNFRVMSQYNGTYITTDPETGETRKLPYHWLDIIQPKNIPEGVSFEEIQYDLKRTEVRKPSSLEWVQNTGGVNGRGDRLHGISADAFAADHIYELVGKALAPVLDIDPQVARRVAQVRQLEEALKQVLLHKVLHRGERSPPETVG